MALNYVDLTLDLYDGRGNPVEVGTATLVPSAVLTDTTDHQLVGTGPISVPFSGPQAGTMPPQVRLLATDNTNVSPSGWAWTITPPAYTGIAAFSFFLPYSGGASQYLSAQAPVVPPQTFVPAVGLPVYSVAGPTGQTAIDTVSVQGAITRMTAAGGNGTLQFQDGTYQVDSNALVIRNCSNFAVAGTGATVIEQAPNRSALPNNTTGNIFTVADCTDFRVEGITFDGLRDTVAPITPLTAPANSGQASVTVASGNGSRYQVGQSLAVFGGLGTGQQAQFDGWGGGGGATALTVSSITAGGGSGGGDLITFTTNLAHTYSALSSTLVSDGFGPYACDGAYLTPYGVAQGNSVAGRSLGGEDQQNGLHLLNCQRFTVTRCTARNTWQSSFKAGTGFAPTSLSGDSCSQGVFSDCIAYHGYDQGYSVWVSQQITVSSCVANATGWGGVVFTASDYCVASGNQVLNQVFQVPVTLSGGYGLITEGGRGNQFARNVISGTYNNAIFAHQSPIGWGLVSTYPTTSAFIEDGTAAGTSIQISSTSALEVGGLYSILDGPFTEAVTVASIVDGTHVTFSQAVQYSHASGVPIYYRVAEGNVFEGNTVISPGGAGIVAVVAVRNAIRGNSLRYCGTQGISLAYTSSLPAGQVLAGNGSQIEGNIIWAPAGTGIATAGSSDLKITGNTVTGLSVAFIQAIDISGVTDSTVTGNYVTDVTGTNGRGIFGTTGGPSATGCARVTISGNVIRRTVSGGIFLQGATSMTIIGNVVHSCGGNAGVDLQGTAYSVVADNVCTSNQNEGIKLENFSATFSQYNRVTGNTCRDDGTGVNVTTGASWTQQIGVQETGSSNNNLFTGNECDSNASGQIVTLGAQSYAWNNIISGAVAPGTDPSGGAGATLPSDAFPAGNGLAAWSWDIATCGTTGTLATGGSLYLTAVTLQQATLISFVWFVLTAAAVTPTSGESQIGIYNSSGTLVASATAAATATAMVGSSATKLALSSPQTLPAGLYWVGMVFQAATEPAILRAATNNGNYINLGTTLATLRTGVNGTGITTALPSTITPASNTQSGSNNYWVGLS